VTRAVLVLAAALALAACGSESPKESVKKTVQSYVNGLGTQDGKKVCDTLAPSVQNAVKQRGGAKDCPTAIDNFEKSATGKAVAPAFKNATVSTVTLSGDKATAVVSVKVAGQEANTTVPLEKVNGKWRITAAAEG
jgi:Putative lumazine-binding